MKIKLREFRVTAEGRSAEPLSQKLFTSQREVVKYLYDTSSLFYLKIVVQWLPDVDVQASTVSPLELDLEFDAGGSVDVWSVEA